MICVITHYLRNRTFENQLLLFIEIKFVVKIFIRE